MSFSVYLEQVLKLKAIHLYKQKYEKVLQIK